jgi:ribokinase
MIATALFVGDTTWDVTICLPAVPAPDEKVLVSGFHESAGGVVANAAVACALAGVPTRALLRVGLDDAGVSAIRCLQARGVAAEPDAAEGETARATILLEPHGEKRLLLYPGGGLYPSRRSVMALDLAGIGWVHTAIYDLDVATELVARCRLNGVAWSIDLEPATFSEGITRLAPVLDGAAVVFCNDRASTMLGDDAHETLVRYGVRSTVQTFGRYGALWRAGPARHDVRAQTVPVVDTTGAGDCLAGWFVAEMMMHGDPAPALFQAVRAATDSCRRPGAQASYTTREAISRAA